MSDDKLAAAHRESLFIYEGADGDVRLDVRFDRETVWLSLSQMARLFGRDRSAVRTQVRNVLSEGELNRNEACAKFPEHRSEPGRNTARYVEYYNLEMVISVGYRLKSPQGPQFRIWATRKLREHMSLGYPPNQRPVANQGSSETGDHAARLGKTIEKCAPDDAAEAATGLIADYADTWRLLSEYDDGSLANAKGRRPPGGILGHDSAIRAIGEFKRELLARGEASPQFGDPRGEALREILGSLEQAMLGEPVFWSCEEQAANLLYRVVKDRPFTEGNKRIGSLLFLLFLKQAGVAHPINPATLTVLTIVIAKSAPDEKGLMIGLVVSLLTGPCRGSDRSRSDSAAHPANREGTDR